jgi:ADP-ribosylglycohydrolase
MDGVRERAAGTLLAMAAGDALGAGYEFGPALGPDVDVVMKGGGPFHWAPGEWTDDTSMAIPVLGAAEVASRAGDSLLDHLDEIAQAWFDWSRSAPDVGAQTSAVLGSAVEDGVVTAARLRVGAVEHLRRTGRAGGNGSLMRTAPVALAALGNPSAIAETARAVSDLTHAEDDAGDACVLWCLAIDHGVRTGELDAGVGIDHLPPARADVWAARLREARDKAPVAFPQNGWVVHALQAAVAAITAGQASDDPVRVGLETAVRAGGDTDTVACIAGQLLGAAYGASAVPREWVEPLHGWPGLTGEQLASRGAALAASGTV